MDKLMQKAPQSFRGRFYQQDHSKKEARQILVLKTGVAGIQHHIKSEEERIALESVAPGTELILYREPDNKYDKWAIAVHLTKDDKIGFISRFKNETIARLMDAGKRFVAIADDPEELEIEDENGCVSQLAPTENMKIPFSIYLIED